MILNCLRIKLFQSFQILSFLLREVTENLRHPDRVLIGGEDKYSVEALKNIYLNWVKKKKYHKIME